MGLDMPAYRSIIRDTKRFTAGTSWGMADIPVLEYEQMAGRAGRPGKEDKGEAILIAKDAAEADALVEHYIRRCGEQQKKVRLTLSDEALEYLLLSLTSLDLQYAFVNQPVEVLRDIVSAYRDAGGRGPLALQVHLSWTPTLDEAEAIAHDQWRTNVFTEPVNWDTETPEAFDVMAEHVGIDGVRRAVEVSEDLSWHRDRIAELAAVGFDDVYLHFVGQEQGGFIDAFGEHVLPSLRG